MSTRPARPAIPPHARSYRYDEIDRDFLAEPHRRVPRPGGAPPRRRADRGRVQAAAAEERPLPAAARLHAADRHPLRHADVARSCASSPTSPRRTTGATATSPRGRTSSSTGRSSNDVPDILDRAGRGRDARHPDLAATASATSPADQFAGRRAPTRSRTRGLGRDHAPVVDVPSGVHLPAAQVQDRRHRRRRHDRAAVRVHDIGLTHRSATTRGELGFEVMVGGGLGPHADDRQDDPRVPAERATCSPISKRSCASTTATAAATTSTRRASRSWCTSSAPRSSARRSRPSAQRHAKDGALDLPETRSTASRRYFAPPAYRDAAGRRRRRSMQRARRRRRPSPAGREHNVHAAQGAGLRHRHASR